MNWYKSPQHPHEWFSLVAKVLGIAWGVMLGFGIVAFFLGLVCLCLADPGALVIALVVSILVNRASSKG